MLGRLRWLMAGSAVLLALGTCDALHVPGTNTAEPAVLHVVSQLRPKEGLATSWACSSWRWKERLLGDGQDFFVPKPRTTRSVATALLESAPMLAEACVLGNCARLDFYLATAAPASGEDVLQSVARFLAEQVTASEATVTPFTDSTAWLDRPDQVLPLAVTRSPPPDNSSVQTFASVLTVASGVEPVTRHCCTVAAGLTKAGRFAPFSSRDAHVLLQFKRTLDAAAGPGASPAPCGPRVGSLLRNALSAGKAARNPTVVPDILALRSRLGGHSAGDEATAAEAARKLAVAPAVERVQAELASLDRRAKITSFRDRAKQAALLACASTTLTDDERRAVDKELQRLLHKPTTTLRVGGDLNDEESVNRVVSAVVKFVDGRRN